MKNFLLISALIGASLLIMCNSSSDRDSGKPAIVKSDTTDALAYYKDYYDGQIKVGLLKRVVRDSFTFVNTDSLTLKKTWTKDTFYIQQVYVPVDTASSRTYKLPIKDSTGKQNYIYYNIVTDKRFVRSGWNGVDSLFLNGLRDQQ